MGPPLCRTASRRQHEFTIPSPTNAAIFDQRALPLGPLQVPPRPRVVSWKDAVRAQDPIRATEAMVAVIKVIPAGEKWS